MLIYRYAAVTDRGKVRGNNEDNFYVDGVWKTDAMQSEFFSAGAITTGALTAAVCDGMGGEANGEEASLAAVEVLCKYDGKEWTADATAEYIREANDRVCAITRRMGKRCGSTLCLLTFSGNKASAVNLGDSRIYHFKNDELAQLSVDHSIVGRMIRQGKLTEAEARTHPMRHRITQFLGIEPEEMELQPAIRSPISLSGGDRYLICSDGLTDMLTNQEIRDILAEVPDTQEAAKKLKDQALQSGGRDNVTIVLIDVIQTSFLKRIFHRSY